MLINFFFTSSFILYIALQCIKTKCPLVLILQNLFVKRKINRLKIALITSYTILLTCTPINPPIENLFVCTYFYLCESLIISENLFLFMIISENLFYSWSSVKIYFLSLYENKLVYESNYLKQIFYHQNTIMIFCWFRIFQFYLFCPEFISFCVWLLFYWIKCL